MPWSATQRYAAEFVGTFLLLAAVTTAVEVAQGGVGLAQVASPVLVISFAIGFALAAGIYAVGEVSGGHFNPAVTVAMAIARRMPTRDVVPYIVAQVLGGLAGVFAVAAFVVGSASDWSYLAGASFGAQGYSGGAAYYSFPYWSVLIFEVTVTFLFIFVILRLTRPENGSKNLAPLAIGLTLVLANLLGIVIDGASFNPARSFAPAIVSQIWPGSGGAWALGQSWIFWVAPIIGGVLAALVDLYFRLPPASAGTAVGPPPGSL